MDDEFDFTWSDGVRETTESVLSLFEAVKKALKKGETFDSIAEAVNKLNGKVREGSKNG